MESSHSNAVNDCWSRCAHAPPRPFTPLPARAPRQTAALALAYVYRCDERAGGARALRTDRGERLAVRRSPTRFRCAFFGPSQLHARRSGRFACGGAAPITLAVARNCARAKLERQRQRSTPGGAKYDFSPSDAKWNRFPAPRVSVPAVCRWLDAPQLFAPEID